MAEPLLRAEDATGVDRIGFAPTVVQHGRAVIGIGDSEFLHHLEVRRIASSPPSASEAERDGTAVVEIHLELVEYLQNRLAAERVSRNANPQLTTAVDQDDPFGLNAPSRPCPLSDAPTVITTITPSAEPRRPANHSLDFLCGVVNWLADPSAWLDPDDDEDDPFGLT